MKPKKRCILIVEDDLDTSDMLRAYFEGQGYEVITAAWGNDALQLCQETVPDLIIQDIRLPDISGYEVVKQLRRNVRTQQVPMIFLTEKRERADRIAGLKLGAVDYITKPFDMQELRLRVRNALRRANFESLVSPVTGLPSEQVVMERLGQLLDRDDWAVVQIGIQGIEAFKEVYGFVAGDDVLRAVGLIISNVVEEAGTLNDFVGHMGTADFILITVPAKIAELQEKIVTRLKRAINYFYPIKDRERGFTRLGDVSGEGQQVPLMSAVIGCVTHDSSPFGTAREIRDAAGRQQRAPKSVN